MLGPGTTFNDRYVLLSRLGGGGMGEVWRARDTVLERVVALKVMTPALTDDAKFTRRFQNEARAMATLRHPGVVDVYDYGVCDADGRPVSYLVMAFVEGEALDRVLRRGPLTPAATMKLVAEVADALAAAHERGIVHRDVKPGNLLIRADGSPILVDFGIAHTVSAQLTATGAMLCSAGYCAPELATDSEVTPSVDLYALGVVAYECLAGRLPFEGETPVQIIYKHLHAPIPPLPDEVPAGPRRLIMRALEKTPERRWASAADLALAARQFVADPTRPAASELGKSLVRQSVADPTDPSPLPEGPGTGPVRAARTTRTTRTTRKRRAASASLAMTGAVMATAAVAAVIWMRPAPADESGGTYIPGLSPTTVATQPVQVSKEHPAAPPAKQSPRPRPSGGHTPTVTPTVTVTPTATPTVTPTKDPTTPTAHPTTPGPEEPPTTEPPDTEPPGDIQCIKAPCNR